MTALMIQMNDTKTDHEKSLENFSIFESNKNVMNNVKKNVKTYSILFFSIVVSQSFLFKNDLEMMVSFLFATLFLTFVGYVSLTSIFSFFFEKPHHITTSLTNIKTYNKTLLVIFCTSLFSYAFVLSSLTYVIYLGYAELGLS